MTALLNKDEPAIHSAVLDAVDRVARAWKASPKLLLNEDDLVCQMMRELDDALGGAREAIHAKVSWFNDQEDLRLRPDITIVEPTNLDLNTPAKLNTSKRFSFSGPAICIECKLYLGSPNLKEVRKDIRTLQALKLRHGNNLFAFHIVFVRHNRDAGVLPAPSADITTKIVGLDA